MKAKDSIIKINESETAFGGCKVGDKSCLIESIFNKIPEKEIFRYRNYLIDENFEKIMKDEEFANCINDFFDCDLNIAETSRKSFLHRNTLLYRLQKVKELTGLDIKTFSDAVTFKLLMMIYNQTR